MNVLKKILSLTLIAFFIFSLLAIPVQAETESNIFDMSTYIDGLDSIVESAMRQSNTPGVSIAIVGADGVWLRNYGYADTTLGIEVTSDTLFEIGSMSKAFTGLGILYLEQQGKISLDDDITDYIPWLTFHFTGNHRGQEIDGEVPVTIANVLFQTTGIPFRTVGFIPEGNCDDMLEKTVRTLIGTRLDFYPGTRHSYATINYNILGLIIQIVSGQGYEDFMTERILTPLGLYNTHMTRNEARETGLFALGYKTEFFTTSVFNAPEFRGSTPTGYIISSANDMVRWMQIQMGIADVPDNFRELVRKSHIGDSTVPSSGNFLYAAGWSVHIRGETISHGGSNPNFSSSLQIDMEKGIGISVLTNLNSSAAGYITNNFFNLLYNRDLVRFRTDMYQTMNTVFTLIFFGAIIFGGIFFVLFILAVVEMFLKKRQREKSKGIKVAGILISLPIMLFFGYCIYYLPNILFFRLPWEAVNVWGSRSIMYGSIAGLTAGIMFFLYVIFTFNFPKPKEKNYFALVPLSLINGLTSALLIFTINETFNRDLEYSVELFVYFIFSLTFLVYSSRLFQSRMIIITNEIAYEKRVGLIEKIVNSSYQAIEKIGGPRICSGLNNDTGVYARLPGLIIGFVSNVMTLLFCLGLLYTISIPAFIASVFILTLNCYVGFLTGKISRRYWEKNRTIQDTYFGQMNDLVYGFKELVLSKLRKIAFWNDMKRYSRMSAELSKEAEVKFLNFGIYNHIMYNSIFGIVVFVIPLLVVGISSNDLRQTLFMVFYLLGPFGAIVGFIPAITNIKVNLDRIKNLTAELDEISTGYSELESTLSVLPNSISVKFDNVVYSYLAQNVDTGEESAVFTLGPVCLEIKTGEIIYITGGNGSGKSTLGKVITGLYSPHDGKTLINGRESNIVELNECFSAVYSDFYLFKKLYGVDSDAKSDEILNLLRMMKIDDKVELNEDGSFKSLNLSTGQRKRLAYVVCCMDEKPLLLFDEWAAEQDPEFRQYFYTELLPGLKKKGKGVVVITHDDRFFNLADKMIKLEHGVIV